MAKKKKSKVGTHVYEGGKLTVVQPPPVGYNRTLAQGYAWSEADKEKFAKQRQDIARRHPILASIYIKLRAWAFR